MMNIVSESSRSNKEVWQVWKNSCIGWAKLLGDNGKIFKLNRIDVPLSGCKRASVIAMCYEFYNRSGQELSDNLQTSRR